MSNITENTRVGVKIGSFVGAAALLLAIGGWLGDLRADRANTLANQATAARVQELRDAAQAKIDDRQDASIVQLQKTVQDMNTTLQLIKQAQDQQLPQLIRQSTYTTEVVRNIEVALASTGIRTKEHGP